MHIQHALGAVVAEQIAIVCECLDGFGGVDYSGVVGEVDEVAAEGIQICRELSNGSICKAAAYEAYHAVCRIVESGSSGHKLI